MVARTCVAMAHGKVEGGVMEAWLEGEGAGLEAGALLHAREA